MPVAVRSWLKGARPPKTRPDLLSTHPEGKGRSQCRG